MTTQKRRGLAPITCWRCHRRMYIAEQSTKQMEFQLEAMGWVYLRDGWHCDSCADAVSALRTPARVEVEEEAAELRAIDGFRALLGTPRIREAIHPAEVEIVAAALAIVSIARESSYCVVQSWELKSLLGKCSNGDAL